MSSISGLMYDVYVRTTVGLISYDYGYLVKWYLKCLSLLYTPNYSFQMLSMLFS